MRNKLITAIIALSLVLCCMVGATMAWLMDSTKTVVNTFTYGDVEITLKESPYNATNNSYGTPDEGVSNAYPMIPGTTYTKDPIVTVKANSEDCYLFIKISEEGNAANYLDYELNLSEWTALTDHTGVYYRVVKKSANDQTFKLLVNDRITVNATKVTKENMKEATKAKLSFTAYAVQKANVADAATAWAIINPTP